MKLIKSKLLFTMPVLLSSVLAYGHDPKEHVAEAEVLDCSSMMAMDHEKMDMKDPVVMAMMTKCQAQMADMHANHGTENVAGNVTGDATATEHSHAAAADAHEQHEHNAAATAQHEDHANPH